MLFFILISKPGNLSSPRVNSYQQWNCYCSLGTSKSCCCCGTETSPGKFTIPISSTSTLCPNPSPALSQSVRCSSSSNSSAVPTQNENWQQPDPPYISLIGGPSNGKGYWCGEKVEWIWRRVGGGVDGHTPNQQRRTVTDSRGVFSAVGGYMSSLLSVDTNGQDIATGAQIEHPFSSHTTRDTPNLSSTQTHSPYSRTHPWS